MTNPNETESSGYALVIQRAAMLPADRWTAERISAIKRTCCPPNVTVAELAMFLTVCHRYELDALVGEVWLAKGKGDRLQVLTGRDSFLKVARRDPDFAGMIFGTVREKDLFEVARSDGKVVVNHSIPGFNRGKLIGAYCVLRLKTRPDIYVQRGIEQYTHLTSKDNWKNDPEGMIETRTVVRAFRLAFNLAGVYTPAEDPMDASDEEDQTEAVKTATVGTSDQLRARLNQLAEESKVEVKEETIEEPEIEEGDAKE